MAAFTDAQLRKEFTKISGWLSGPRQAYVNDLLAKVSGNAPAGAASGNSAPAKKTASKRAPAKKEAEEAT